MARTLSLRSYLLRAFVWLIAPILVAGLLVQWHLESSLLRSQFDHALVGQAAVLATLVTGAAGELHLEFADEFMPQYSRAEQPHYFQAWSRDGASLERSFSLDGEDLPFRHGTLDEPEVFYATLAEGTELRCVGIQFPVRVGHGASDPLEAVVIVVGLEASLLSTWLERGALEVLLTGVVSLLGVGLVVIMACRGGARVFEEVAQQVQSIQPSSPTDALDEASVPEEIRPIVLSLKEALKTIGAISERERRFNADVAHELRTPIAELRSAAEVALRWPDSDASTMLAHDAKAIAIQMASLVESLLQLAALESETPSGSRLLDLDDHVRACVAEVERVERKGHCISVQSDDALEIRSRPHLWDIVIRNLLDNACEYSPPGSRIEVRLRPDGDGACLEITNPTDTLRPEDLSRCTERLWSKSREEGSPHFGLGLSIVQAAARQLGHHFSLSLEHGFFRAIVAKGDPA